MLRVCFRSCFRAFASDTSTILASKIRPLGTGSSALGPTWYVQHRPLTFQALLINGRCKRSRRQAPVTRIGPK